METKLQSAMEFRKRFVNDYRLPITILESPYFEYFLNLYEPIYQSLSLYNKAIELINENYKGNYQLFLDNYYNIRENIIQTILNNDAYKAFINMDNNTFMQKYTFKEQYPNKNICKEDLCGQLILSIDLSKANYQTLNFVDNNILLNTNSYEEFIGKFSNEYYIKESKYTRQVIFGKLNPKRTITVERFITHKIYQLLSKSLLNEQYTLISLNNDELIFTCEINDDIKHLKEIENKIIQLVLDNLNIQVKAVFARLTVHHFLLPNNTTLSSFIKHKLVENTETFIGTNAVFLPQIYNLLDKGQINDNDLFFNHEGIVAKFVEPIKMID